MRRARVRRHSVKNRERLLAERKQSRPKGTPEMWRESRRKQRESITPNYVAQILEMPLASIPAEIIALKRAALLLKRELGITNKKKP